MIKKVLLFSLLVLFLMSCSSAKTVSKPRGVKKGGVKKVSIADKIVWTAVSYKGAPYRYAGTTKKGMDCSGLIHTSFKKRGVILPRTSKLMYGKGFPIKLREVRRGDLLFFKTSNKRGRVNHVGLVTSIKNGKIRFIHSTSSRGVIVTGLEEKYWKRAFIIAKRVL